MINTGRNLLEGLPEFFKGKTEIFRVLLIGMLLFPGALLRGELPASNQIDKINSQVQSLCEAGKWDLAITEKEKIFNLGVPVPTEDYFNYAEILSNYSLRKNFQARSKAISVLEKYMALAGKDCPNYKPAMELYKELGNMESFKACGLEWKFLQANVTWDDAQSLIKSLGTGWRGPTREELKKLYVEVENQGPLKDGWAWSGELKDPSTAWYFGFNFGKENCYYRGFSTTLCFAVAVRSQ
ncbi:MAG: DUF1566 domain-containing protein [Candidatus Riflebacteria bacterium]|nr:DUF1566 domain-containing protein [Candidatus Riflebacteria bacterium]